jgi:unsaturated rhamnogalacturonyl hydrolase
MSARALGVGVVVALTVRAHAQAPSRTSAIGGAATGRPWSVRVAESVMRRSPGAVLDKWDYTAGLVLLAMQRLGSSTGDPRYAKYVWRSIDSLVAADGSISSYQALEYNLDQINEGRVLFSLADNIRDPRYARAAARLRAQLAEQPRTANGGFWHKKIYPDQMWLDGLYMAEPFYAQFAALRADTMAMNDVAHQFSIVVRELRDSATGLYYHAWDSARRQPWADPKTGRSKNFWGRADGWYLMAAIDVLDYLPPNHSGRPALIRVVRELADAVARVQDTSGVWWQVLDQPNRQRNYLEESASAMFVYSFAKGARLGYLDARYRRLAERAFDAMLRRFVTTDEDGLVSIHGICKVAGLGGNPPRDGSYDYYVSEPVVSDDYKGVGAFMLAAIELGR